MNKARVLSRRAFLLYGGGAGLTVAAALAVRKPGLRAEGGATQGKRATRGYHASEHIDNYYRTTKV